MPVEELQDKIVDALQAAAGRRICRIARQFLELVVDPADHAVDPAVDSRVRSAQQDRRHVFFVKYDLPVPNFEHACNAETREARFGGLAKLEAQSRKGN